MSMIPPELKGLGRGIFGLKSWDPLRKPGQQTASKPTVVTSGDTQNNRNNSNDNGASQQSAATAPNSGAQVKSQASQPNNNGNGKKLRIGRQVIAKYTYKANAGSPLGKTELNMMPGQKFVFIEEHPENEHWWEVRGEDGEQGYIPASYMVIVEEKVTGLPWLENKKSEEPADKEKYPQENPVWKPYKSAYAKPAADEPEDKSQYYCSVCDKQLNGPQPYGAHMKSKAHKEEVENAEYYANK